MLHVGLDLHKRFSFVTIMNDEGTVIRRARLANERKVIKGFFGQFEEPLSIAIEATWNWYWLQDILEEEGYPIKLAHPLKTKAIASARIKTDKIDSEILAHLLRTDLLPEAYISNKKTRLSKEILRYRASLVNLRTQIRNKLHAIVVKNGLTLPNENILSKRSVAYLEQVSLPKAFREALNGYLRVVGTLNAEIMRVTQLIRVEAEEDEQVKRLIGIYGIGYYTGLIIVREIENISRFEKAKRLSSYAGLVPSVHSSGSVHYTGHITKEGSKWLRWALVEAAQHAIKREPYASFYRRIAKRRGKGIAKIAVARKLCEAIYYTLSG